MTAKSKSQSSQAMARRKTRTTRQFEILLIAAASLYVAHTLFSLLSYSTDFSYTLRFAGISKLAIPYGDLVQLTYTAGCDAPLEALSDGSQTCDPSGRPYNLMFPALLLFKTLGINSGSHPWIGLAMGIGTIATLVIFLEATKKEIRLSGRLYLFIISLSCFPMQLAVERGNTDLVIFVAISWFCLALHKFKRLSSLLSLFSCLALSVFAILFKLWAGPGMILAFTKEIISRRKSFQSSDFRALATATALAGAAFIISYLSSGHVFRHTEVWEGHFSFGLNASYYAPALGEPGLYKPELRIWKIAAASTAAFISWRQLQASSHRPAENNPSLTHTTLTVGYLVYACVYFLSNSWDYRLICLIFCLPFFFSNTYTGGTAIRMSCTILIAFTLFELYIPVQLLAGAPETFSDLIAQPVLLGLLGSCVFQNTYQ